MAESAQVGATPATVELLWFAALKEITGRREETLVLPDGVDTVADLVGFLERTRPELTGRLASCRVAVDEEFANLDQSLRGAASVALIPPVSGG